MLNIPITAGCAPVAGEFFCYKVQTGDSVWAIGAMFNLPWGELCAYNELANCSAIPTENFSLKIPIVGGPSAQRWRLGK